MKVGRASVNGGPALPGAGKPFSIPYQLALGSTLRAATPSHSVVAFANRGEALELHRDFDAFLDYPPSQAVRLLTR